MKLLFRISYVPWTERFPFEVELEFDEQIHFEGLISFFENDFRKDLEITIVSIEPYFNSNLKNATITEMEIVIKWKLSNYLFINQNDPTIIVDSPICNNIVAPIQLLATQLEKEPNNLVISEIFQNVFLYEEPSFKPIEGIDLSELAFSSYDSNLDVKNMKNGIINVFRDDIVIRVNKSECPCLNDLISFLMSTFDDRNIRIILIDPSRKQTLTEELYMQLDYMDIVVVTTSQSIEIYSEAVKIRAMELAKNNHLLAAKLLSFRLKM